MTSASGWRTAPGAGLIKWSRRATALFSVAAVAAAVAPDALARPVAVLDLALFVLGTGAFLVAFARAVRRSREEQVDVLGVFFLGGGVAPPDVRRQLLGSAATQAIVAIVTASTRPYTAVAYGVLVPMLGLGLAGLWGASHGRFPPRAPAASHSARAPEDQADCTDDDRRGPAGSDHRRPSG